MPRFLTLLFFSTFQILSLTSSALAEAPQLASFGVSAPVGGVSIDFSGPQERPAAPSNSPFTVSFGNGPDLPPPVSGSFGNPAVNISFGGPKPPAASGTSPFAFSTGCRNCDGSQPFAAVSFGNDGTSSKGRKGRISVQAGSPYHTGSTQKPALDVLSHASVEIEFEGDEIGGVE